MGLTIAEALQEVSQRFGHLGRLLLEDHATAVGKLRASETKKRVHHLFPVHVQQVSGATLTKADLEGSSRPLVSTTSSSCGEWSPITFKTLHLKLNFF